VVLGGLGRRGSLDSGEAAGGASQGGGEAGSRSSQKFYGGRGWCGAVPARGARWCQGVAVAAGAMPARGQRGRGNKRPGKVWHALGSRFEGLKDRAGGWEVELRVGVNGASGGSGVARARRRLAGLLQAVCLGEGITTITHVKVWHDKAVARRDSQ
jgi:hypothetical protein